MSSLISSNSYQQLPISQIMGITRCASNIATSFYSHAPHPPLGQSLRRIFCALGDLHGNIESDLCNFPHFSAHWAYFAYSRLQPEKHHRTQLIAKVIELEKLQKSTQIAAITASNSDYLKRILASHTATLQILIDQLTSLMPAHTSYRTASRTTDWAQQ